MPTMSVYIGGLSVCTVKEDLEREFRRFGNLTRVWVSRNTPRFAFVDFEYDDDAEEAINEMDGAEINGVQVRVDVSREGSRRGVRGCRRGDGNRAESRSLSASPPRRHPAVAHMHSNDHIPRRGVSPAPHPKHHRKPLGPGEREKLNYMRSKHERNHSKDVSLKMPYRNPSPRYHSPSPSCRYPPSGSKTYGPTLHEHFSSVAESNRTEPRVRYSRKDLEKTRCNVRDSSRNLRHGVHDSHPEVLPSAGGRSFSDRWPGHEDRKNVLNLDRDERGNDYVPVSRSRCRSGDRDFRSERYIEDELIDDFARILETEDHSDFSIKVKGTEFRLHKSILAARSPFFSAMFKAKMKEEKTSMVSIGDCEPEVFRSFIYFVYTGKLETLSHDNVCALYEVADKYQQDTLKAECLKFMKEKICVNTFCDFVALALDYDEDELLESAIDLFCMNTKEIILTVKWQTFLREYPTESNELYIKALDFISML